MEKPTTKQWIVVRTDLDVSIGKLCTQAAHSSMKTFFDRMTTKKTGDEYEATFKYTEEEKEWIENMYTKITCRAKSLNDLMKMYSKAKKAGLTVSIIEDQGFTELDGPTITAIAIGPHSVKKANPVTKRLQTLNTRLQGLR